MAATKVGIREFRDNLSNYLLTSDSPVAITRHGDTVGFFIPVRRKRTEAEREALREAGRKMEAMMTSLGLTEEDMMKDYEAIRAEERKSRSSR